MLLWTLSRAAGAVGAVGAVSNKSSHARICCYGRFLELLELLELWELSVINQIMREYLHAKDYLRVDEWCFHFYCHLLYPVYANGTFGCFINGYVSCFLLYGGDGLESAKNTVFLCV